MNALVGFRYDGGFLTRFWEPERPLDMSLRNIAREVSRHSLEEM